MDTLEFVAVVVVVITIFISPFVMSKILSRLRRKAEPQYAISNLNGMGEENYKLLKENVRSFAIFFIFIGVVGVIGILLNDIGERKLIYLSLMLILLISAVGIWFRQIWGAWIIGLLTLSFAISIINTDLETIIKSMPLYFFAVYSTYKVSKNILEIRRIEGAGS